MDERERELWIRQERARERRRAIQRRRRKNQLIRRGVLLVCCFCMAIFGFRKVVAGKENHTLMQADTLEQEPDYRAAEGNGFFGQLAAAIQQETDADRNLPKGPEDIRIVVDAGHGGKDPGTLWKDVYEKDINLAIAKKLADILKAAGYQVFMTRETDERVVLSDRVRLAEEKQADLFISVHQNALEKDTVTEGIEIFSSSRTGSEELAEKIRGELISATQAVDKGITKNSDLYVLENTTMPACLIETGFLTSAAERERLLDADYQQRMAQGIADGILKFLKSY